MHSFRASLVSFERVERYEYEFLGLAESEDIEEGLTLQIQLAFEFDDQDRELGMDTYCVVDQDQNTHYGGISSWRVASGVLEFDFAPDAAEEFGAAGYRIELPDDEAMAVVTESLPRLLLMPAG